MNIPIANIYYLLCYAWDTLDEGKTLNVATADCRSILDLLARVLSSGTNHLLRRGIDRDYAGKREEIRGLRGKLDVSATLKRGLVGKPVAVCEYDDMMHNVLHNQILKSTIGGLLRAQGLDRNIARELRLTHLRLQGIDEIRMTHADFRRVQLHRNNRAYRLLLSICRLVHDRLLVDEQTGATRFRDFERDPVAMRRLFERFVFSFYRKEQTAFFVRRKQLVWAETAGTDHDLSLLPVMQTDVMLTSPERVMIVETKFTPQPLQHHFGKASLRSEHLYQLYAYLKNFRPCAADAGVLEGVLLYPLAETPLSLRLELQGIPIQVRTLDLSRPWPQIHDDLLELVS